MDLKFWINCANCLSPAESAGESGADDDLGLRYVARLVAPRNQGAHYQAGRGKLFDAKVVGISRELLTNIYLPPALIAEMGRVFLRNPDMYTKGENGKFGIEGLVRVRDPKEIPQIRREIKKLGMKSTTLEDVIGFIHGLFGALSAILTVFVMIAGVVAFFSIVNTLFMAVSEHKREIGVLQAWCRTQLCSGHSPRKPVSVSWAG